MPPPMIIMISRLLPWLVLWPRPVIARAKMHGHMVLQNRPTLMKATALALPVVNMPISSATMPHSAK